MGGFRFRLAQLLQLRTVVRDQCRERLAHALAAEQQILQKIDDCRLQVQSAQALLRTAQQSTDYSVAAVQRNRQFVAGLTGQVAAGEQQLQDARKLVEERRRELASADQQVRMLEKMRDRQHAEHQQVLEHREQIQREEAWLAVHTGGRES